MPTLAVERDLLLEILARRDALVHAITAGIASDSYDGVMRAFDGLLAALKRLEDSLPGVGGDETDSGRPA